MSFSSSPPFLLSLPLFLHLSFSCSPSSPLPLSLLLSPFSPPTQLIRVSTPAGVGQQRIGFVLITSDAVYLLRNGEEGGGSCSYVCVCVLLVCILPIQRVSRDCIPENWESNTLNLNILWYVTWASCEVM